MTSGVPVLSASLSKVRRSPVAVRRRRRRRRRRGLTASMHGHELTALRFHTRSPPTGPGGSPGAAGPVTRICWTAATGESIAVYHRARAGAGLDHRPQLIPTSSSQCRPDEHAHPGGGAGDTTQLSSATYTHCPRPSWLMVHKTPEVERPHPDLQLVDRHLEATAIVGPPLMVTVVVGPLIRWVRSR